MILLQRKGGGKIIANPFSFRLSMTYRICSIKRRPTPHLIRRMRRLYEHEGKITSTVQLGGNLNRLLRFSLSNKSEILDRNLILFYLTIFLHDLP